MKKTTALLALAGLALAAYVALAPFAEFMARTFLEGVQ